MGELSFIIDERRPSSLLVASISGSATRSPLPFLSMQLPLSGSNLLRDLHTKVDVKNSLSATGAEVQRLSSLLGGLLLAGAAQAAQRVATVRPGKNNRNSRYQGHHLPFFWDQKQVRKTREAEDLAKALGERGHLYERSLDVRAAVQCFEEASKLVPDNHEYLCMAAKQWTDLTFHHDVKTDKERRLVNNKAIEYSNKALELAPDCAHCYVASCVSKGRLALFSDNKNKVRLAKEAQDAAAKALSMDPSLDLAHHLMGRWHYEMARVNSLVRTLVRIMYGTDLPPGTKEGALKCFEKAIKIAPNRLIHKVEAGRVLLDLGERERGVAFLEEAMRLELIDINDLHTRDDCEALLKNALKRSKSWMGSSNQLAPPSPPSPSTSSTE